MTAAAIMMSYNANAFSLFGIEFNTSAPAAQEEFSLGFTIPSGSVIDSNGNVTPADQTETGRRSLEQDGYLVAAGNLYVSAGGVTTTIDLNDVRNLNGNKAAIQDLVVDRVKDNVLANNIAGNLSDEALNDIASAEGIVDVSELSFDEVVSLVEDNIDSIIDSGEISGDIVDAIGESVVADVLGGFEAGSGYGSMSDADFQAAIDNGEVPGLTSSGECSSAGC